MNPGIRTSPLHDYLEALQPEWDVVRNMRVAKRIDRGDTAKLETVAIADLSCLERAGLKGPAAAQWLETLNIPAPVAANTWVGLAGGGVIARLGRSEFFLEDGVSGAIANRVRAALGSGNAGVYPVIRQDAGIALIGKRVNELLVQTCSVNFLQIGQTDRTAIMTSMAGVSVLMIRRDHNALPGFRIWCDGTYAPYLWETLAEIAGELGGGPVGTESLLADVSRLE